MMTYADFLIQHCPNMKIEAVRAESNPDMDSDREMDHWRVTLTNGKPHMRLYFSKGVGLRVNKGSRVFPILKAVAPTLPEVLDCLASDASGYDNTKDFEDWATEYGYSEDSRKAERIYRTVAEQAKKLRFLIGDDAYKVLLSGDVERL